MTLINVISHSIDFAHQKADIAIAIMATTRSSTPIRLASLFPVVLGVAEEADVPLVLVLVVDISVPVAVRLEEDLTTVTGTLDPLVAGNVLSVVQFIPTTFGQVSVRFNPLSSGPVGPDSYFQVTFKPKKSTCLGSLSGYCSSPHCPRK